MMGGAMPLASQTLNKFPPMKPLLPKPPPQSNMHHNKDNHMSEDSGHINVDQHLEKLQKQVFGNGGTNNINNKAGNRAK